jgi:amino acid permease
LTAFPIILFAFSCQCNVCAIFSELPDVDNNNNNESTTDAMKLKKKEVFMRNVSWTAVAICTSLYASISAIALTDLGSGVAPNILSSYEIVGILRVACAAMAAAVIMAFPLNIFPARVTLEGILDSYYGNDKPVQEVLLTENSSHREADNENLTAGLLEVVDLVEHQTQDKSAPDSLIVVPPANDHVLSDTGHGSIETISSVGEEDFNQNRHVFLTLLLAGGALSLALVVPNISVVFGLLGGTTSSVLGFCVPGMLGLKLSRDTDDPSLRPVSWTLLIGGLVVGILTTGVTIYEYFGVHIHI